MIVSGVLTTIFATETRAEKFSRTTSKIVHKFCEIPIIIVNFILILILVYIIFVFVRELHERRNKISRASVKESLDKLPTGLCFYRENGRIILLNNSKII